jgi:hypothetical protein
MKIADEIFTSKNNSKYVWLIGACLAVYFFGLLFGSDQSAYAVEFLHSLAG